MNVDITDTDAKADITDANLKADVTDTDMTVDATNNDDDDDDDDDQNPTKGTLILNYFISYVLTVAMTTSLEGKKKMDRVKRIWYL